MSDENRPELPPAELELAKARLRVEDGELVRRHADDGIVTRIPLDDVESVRFVRPFNPLAAAGFLLAGGLVAIGRFVSEYNVMTVLLYVAAMLIGVLVLGGLRSDVVEIRTRGQTLRIECPDSADEVAGFVASIQPRLGGERGRF